MAPGLTTVIDNCTLGWCIRTSAPI